MARRSRNAPAVFVEIPPDNRRAGPLTSDDRGWGNDPTRGADIQCSEVMGSGKSPQVRTVNAREMPYNPYNLGRNDDENEEKEPAR